MDLDTAEKIIQNTRSLVLCTDRNQMSVTGVTGKTNISGYFTVDIDLGQGCVCSDIVYVLPNVLGGNQFFIGKPFLVMINASMSLRHDFISVPDAKGVPISVKYSVFRSEYLKRVTKNQSGTKTARESTYELYDDEIGPVHPWLGTMVNIASGY
jgi:hypothetical protein